MTDFEQIVGMIVNMTITVNGFVSCLKSCIIRQAKNIEMSDRKPRYLVETGYNNIQSFFLNPDKFDITVIGGVIPSVILISKELIREVKVCENSKESAK